MMLRVTPMVESWLREVGKLDEAALLAHQRTASVFGQNNLPVFRQCVREATRLGSMCPAHRALLMYYQIYRALAGLLGYDVVDDELPTECYDLIFFIRNETGHAVSTIFRRLDYRDNPGAYHGRPGVVPAQWDADVASINDAIGRFRR